MNLIPDSKVETLRQAFLSGESVRGAMRQAGVAKLTVEKFYREFRESGMQQPLCACGRESGHKGWCSHRYSKSEARQTFMEHWGKPKQNGNEMPLSDGIVGECRTDPPRDLMKDGIWPVPEHERPPGWERMCSANGGSKESLTTQLSEESGQLTVAPTGGENASIGSDLEDNPITGNTDTAAVNGADRRCEAEGPTPSAASCQCGKPANHRGRCKGSGFPGKKVSARSTDNISQKRKTDSPMQWVFDRMDAGEDPVIVPVPAGAAARLFVETLREEMAARKATGTIRWRFQWPNGEDPKFNGVEEALEAYEKAHTSYFAPSNEAEKEEVASPTALETKEHKPQPDNEPLRTSKDAEKHLLELCIAYWTTAYPDGDHTPDYLCERMAELADEVKVRREIEKAIDEAGAWAYDPDNPSTDPLGDWERAAASIAYRQRLAGRAEEREKLAAKGGISR